MMFFSSFSLSLSRLQNFHIAPKTLQIIVECKLFEQLKKHSSDKDSINLSTWSHDVARKALQKCTRCNAYKCIGAWNGIEKRSKCICKFVQATCSFLSSGRIFEAPSSVRYFSAIIYTTFYFTFYMNTYALMIYYSLHIHL